MLQCQNDRRRNSEISTGHFRVNRNFKSIFSIRVEFLSPFNSSPLHFFVSSQHEFCIKIVTIKLKATRRI